MSETNLKSFVEKLKSEMEDRLNKIALEHADVIPRATQSAAFILSTINALKDFVHHYTFTSIQEEVEFFKFIKPEIVSQLFYFDQLFTLKLNEPYGSKEFIITYYQQELTKLQTLVKANQEFYRYYISGETHRDEEYFTRHIMRHWLIDTDQRFTTGYDNTLAMIQANQMMKDYLVEHINWLILGDESKPSPLSWTGSKADLIELIYALHAASPFNKGDVDIKVIATVIEKAFNFRVGNIYRTYQDIRLRKIKPTNFLDQMKDRLTGDWKRMIDYSEYSRSGIFRVI